MSTHDETPVGLTGNPSPATVRAAWCSLLRSGQFHQGKGQLGRQADHLPAREYCCLGVLTLLLEGEHWRDYLPSGDITIREGAEQELVNSERTPFELSSAAKHRVGLNKDQMLQLVQANDGGETFEQIAARIESFEG